MNAQQKIQEFRRLGVERARLILNRRHQDGAGLVQRRKLVCRKEVRPGFSCGVDFGNRGCDRGNYDVALNGYSRGVADKRCAEMLKLSKAVVEANDAHYAARTPHEKTATRKAERDAVKALDAHPKRTRLLNPIRGSRRPSAIVLLDMAFQACPGFLDRQLQNRINVQCGLSKHRHGVIEFQKEALFFFAHSASIP